MQTKTVFLYNLDEEALSALADLKIVGRAHSREDLRTGVGALKPDALVIDLDSPTALDALTDAREILPSLAVVGLVGEADPKFVISAVRAGCHQISPKPLDVNDLLVAVRRALNESISLVSGKTIGVMGAVGGAGATTIAACLAMGLAEVTKARTLLMDADFDFGGVARAWDVEPDHTIADLLSAGTLDPVLLEKAVVDVPGNVSILARPKTIEQAHGIDESMMTMVLQIARGLFTQSVVDLPHRLDALAWAAIQQCDKLLIVAQMTIPSVDNCARLLKALDHLGMPPEKVDIVINRYRKNVHFLTPDQFAERVRRPIVALLPSDFRSVCAAIDTGQPIPAHNQVRSAIQKLAVKLAGMDEAVSRGSWISRLLRTS
jgi:pilus assembly protein CpaE